MKRYYAAAGALLLGTSALAWAGDTKLSVEPMATTEAKTGMTWDKSVLTAKSDMTSDAKLGLASLDKDLTELAVAETDAKLQTASVGWADKGAMALADDAKLQTATTDWTDAKAGLAMTDGKLELASADSADKLAWADDKVVTASVDGDSKVQTASVDKVDTGMGGPLEEVDTTTSAVVQPSNANPELDARGIPVISDVAFVPTGYNGTGGAVGGPDEGEGESYPACTSERTDNCIQLYERGVRASLSSDKSVELADGKESTAMGGPYEPVDADTKIAMNGDGDVDLNVGETAHSEVDTVAVPTETAVTTHSDFQGVGGPVEAQSGYPPCSPGPGDDRCIQLYERGVTGAGN